MAVNEGTTRGRVILFDKREPLWRYYLFFVLRMWYTPTFLPLKGAKEMRVVQLLCCAESHRLVWNDRDLSFPHFVFFSVFCAKFMNWVSMLKCFRYWDFRVYYCEGTCWKCATGFFVVISILVACCWWCSCDYMLIWIKIMFRSIMRNSWSQIGNWITCPLSDPF